MNRMTVPIVKKSACLALFWALSASATEPVLRSAAGFAAPETGRRVGPPEGSIGPVVGVHEHRRIQVLPGGFGVTLDPATKRIRAATPMEMAGLLAALAGPGAGTETITVVHFAGGAKAAVLPTSTMETLVATRRPDGTVGVECGAGHPHPGECGAKSTEAKSVPGGGGSVARGSGRPAELR